VITCSNKKGVVVFVLQSLTGVASSHLVKYSVALMIYLSPDIFVGGLIGPTKSISHFQIPTELLVVLVASHPFCWVFQHFEKHQSFGNIHAQ
jgi:hypothetical protein